MERVCSQERWRRHTEDVLRKIGIAEGHYVLDCCCGSGTYAVVAARLVGQAGLVYAIDDDDKKLDKLRQEAASRRLGNIRIIKENVELDVPVQDAAVDFVLLYDIFWYFRPAEKKMENLLKEVRRVTRANAVISVYPTHVDLKSLASFKNEMRNNGFVLLSEFSTQLVHERNLVAGTLLNYRKMGHRQDHPQA